MFAEEQGIARLTLEQEEIANFAGIRHSNIFYLSMKNIFIVFSIIANVICATFSTFSITVDKRIRT